MSERVTEIRELRRTLRNAREVLEMAQERLEVGIEVNREGENATRVTATSAHIRKMILVIDQLERDELDSELFSD